MKTGPMKNKIRLRLFILLFGAVPVLGFSGDMAVECEADFDYTYVPTTPIHIQFTDMSTGEPNHWFWDFGDGSTSTEQNPVHPYPESGTYEVCLIIIHDDSLNYCTDTICKEIYIPDTVACEAIFDWTVNPDFPPEVSFTDLSTGNITDWEWNFGDGNTSTEQNPVHVFPATGEYLVCLNVFNADSIASCFHFICKTIEIPDNMNCIAEFEFMADSSSSIMNHFTFVDESNSYPDHWVWDFGDGTISHEQHPVHVYAEPGLYEVKLNSWNSNFPTCNDERTKLVQTPSYYKLGGQAFIGNIPINNPAHAGDTGIAILYRQQSNMGLVAVDTNLFTEYGYYWFNDMMELPYVIKVGLTEGSEHYEDVIPTYFPEMMIWQQADIMMLDEDHFESHTMLMELHGTENGIGNIKGRIVDDLSRDLRRKGNYNKVPVILTNMSSQPLAWTRSNGSGQFSFNNLAYGTYKVYADITGLYSMPEEVTLDEDFPNADSIYIQMSPAPLIGISEAEAPAFDILTLYPNPADQAINLMISSEPTTGIEMMVYNQLGQQMLRESRLLYKGGNKLEINISSLPESIYFLRLQGSNGTPLMRTFIKVD
jgi:PKD repeat protein